MKMNSYHIEDDEMLISERIYHLINAIGVAGAIKLLHATAGNAAMSADVDLGSMRTKLRTHLQQENYAATGYGPLDVSPHRNEYPTATPRGTSCEMPPSDPAAFDAWIVALFLRKVDTSHQHQEWLYARARAPRHIPPTDPAAFDAWITSFFTRSEVNRTHHRDAVRDEQQNRIFMDTLLGGPSGLATVMAGQSYPQHGPP
ncbi:hypothetical protein F5146DRAFT_1176614 [Armillaria mellea]|nr:hypothetical protein F5146DRAFT_1176614 [Armillaria mellea]